MTIRSGDYPWIRPQRSAEPAQKTNRTGGKPSKVARQEVYHHETQIGPGSESEREIVPQKSSLGRSRGACDESCQDSKGEKAIPLKKKRRTGRYPNARSTQGIPLNTNSRTVPKMIASNQSLMTKKGTDTRSQSNILHTGYKREHIV